MSDRPALPGHRRSPHRPDQEPQAAAAGGFFLLRRSHPDHRRPRVVRGLGHPSRRARPKATSMSLYGVSQGRARPRSRRAPEEGRLASRSATPTAARHRRSRVQGPVRDLPRHARASPAHRTSATPPPGARASARATPRCSSTRSRARARCRRKAAATSKTSRSAVPWSTWPMRAAPSSRCRIARAARGAGSGRCRIGAAARCRCRSACRTGRRSGAGGQVTAAAAHRRSRHAPAFLRHSPERTSLQRRLFHLRWSADAGLRGMLAAGLMHDGRSAPGRSAARTSSGTQRPCSTASAAMPTSCVWTRPRPIGATR